MVFVCVSICMQALSEEGAASDTQQPTSAAAAVRVWETRKNLPPALRELLSFNSKVSSDSPTRLLYSTPSFSWFRVLMRAYSTFFCTYGHAP